MIRIILLLFMHIVADFLLQGSSFSKLKQSKTAYLFLHVGIYTAFFIVLSPVLLALTFVQGLIFSLINGSAHLIVDYITGKFKKKYWEISESKYIAAISLDHIFHLAILFITYLYLFPTAYSSSILLN